MKAIGVFIALASGRMVEFLGEDVRVELHNHPERLVVVDWRPAKPSFWGGNKEKVVLAAFRYWNSYHFIKDGNADPLP